jgi:CheY-like chemotaxis protein
MSDEIERMKTDFLAAVSHELRTPLTSVLGFAKLTRNRLEERVFPHVPESDSRGQRTVAQVRGNVDIIVREAERLTQLINDVLDIARMEAGQMEWRMSSVDLADLLARAAEATAPWFAESATTLALDVEPGLPPLDADRDRLLQVLVNLFANAAKFTFRGRATASARRVPGGVEVAVADTGQGIDPAKHASIFQKFQQVGDTLTDKPRGGGLGLAICREITRAHGSDLRLQSALGQGARFSFVLPVGERPPRPASMIPVPAAIPPDRVPDILVVDDDPSVRELLRQQLVERGMDVRLAVDGVDAVEQVRGRAPDLVVLDVLMPRLSGFDVATLLKSDPATRHIPILILSVVPDVSRGRQLGVERTLAKPADADVLALAIGELLHLGDR